MKRTAKEDAQLLAFATRALRGLDDAGTFIGILDDRPMDAARAAFTLQLGHCVLTNKPIIIPVPYGIEIPPKLAAIADRIVRYDPHDLKSMERNLAVALTELGIIPQ